MLPSFHSTDLVLGIAGTVLLRMAVYLRSQNAKKYLAPCACYSYDDTNTTVWNHGHVASTCDGTCSMEDAWGKALVKTMCTGRHDFQLAGDSATCTLCGYTYYGENLMAVAEGRVFESLEKASVGSTVVLLADATVDSLAVGEKTLDLNGHTLTATVFSAVGGTEIGQEISFATSGRLARYS